MTKDYNEQLIQIFLNYAHPNEEKEELSFEISERDRDRAIASALIKSLEDALSPFAQIWWDRRFEIGERVKDTIEEILERTDVFLMVYTGIEKKSHSWAGFEVGYFSAMMKAPRLAGFERRMIPLYLNERPPTEESRLGVSLGIRPADLVLAEPAFKAQLGRKLAALSRPGSEDGLYRLLSSLRESAERIAGQMHMPFRAKPVSDCLGDLYMELYKALRNSPKVFERPQKQIFFCTSEEALAESEAALPEAGRISFSSAEYCQELFGFAATEEAWAAFRDKLLRHRYGGWWVDAISTVIFSSYYASIDLDNSQLIISHDERSIYRLFLSRDIQYYSGARLFAMYFLDGLSSTSTGDPKSFRTGTALSMALRVRGMFLDADAKYPEDFIRSLKTNQLSKLAGDLSRDLALLRRDAIANQLQEAREWRPLVGNYDDVSRMLDIWTEHVKQIKGLISQIRSNPLRPVAELEAIRDRLAGQVRDLCAEIAPFNQRIIQGLVTAV